MDDAPTERWYVAVLVFESRIVEDPGDADSGVDVQYRLVRAVDAESAHQRALALGRRARLSYANSDGNICEWVFQGLQDLQLVSDGELRHGTEVYGFIERGAAADFVVSKEELTEFLGRDRPGRPRGSE